LDCQKRDVSEKNSQYALRPVLYGIRWLLILATTSSTYFDNVRDVHYLGKGKHTISTPAPDLHRTETLHDWQGPYHFKSGLVAVVFLFFQFV
jgi:hypothetical protein